MASLVQPFPTFPALHLRRSSLIRPPSSLRFPLRCNAADRFKFDGGDSAGFHLLTGDAVPASALVSNTRLEDAISKKLVRESAIVNSLLK